MTVRVTVGSSAVASLAGLQAAATRLAALQEKLSTGRQIGVPSDDPAGSVQALKLRTDLKRNAQFERNASDAIGWLSSADSAYGQIVDLAQKARQLTVQGLNTGASTGDSASAIADQIDALRQAAINLANTTYKGRPIFGGTTAGDLAFNADGTYAGDTGVVNRAVGDKNTLQINQVGTDAFGPDDSNFFAVLHNISETLRNGTPPAGVPPLADQLGDLDDSMRDLAAARAASGAAHQRVLAAQQTQQTDYVTLRTHKAQLEDIDLPEVAVQMQSASVVYQAALQTTAGIRQLSLLDFLR